MQKSRMYAGFATYYGPAVPSLPLGEWRWKYSLIRLVALPGYGRGYRTKLLFSLLVRGDAFVIDIVRCGGQACHAEVCMFGLKIVIHSCCAIKGCKSFVKNCLGFY